MTHLLDRRRAGVLCAVSSLPAGSQEQFLDFLAAAGLSVWQVLPLNPQDASGSTYKTVAPFASWDRLTRSFGHKRALSSGQ